MAYKAGSHPSCADEQHICSLKNFRPASWKACCCRTVLSHRERPSLLGRLGRRQQTCVAAHELLLGGGRAAAGAASSARQPPGGSCHPGHCARAHGAS